MHQSNSMQPISSVHWKLYKHLPNVLLILIDSDIINHIATSVHRRLFGVLNVGMMRTYGVLYGGRRLIGVRRIGRLGHAIGIHTFVAGHVDRQGVVAQRFHFVDRKIAIRMIGGVVIA